MTANAVNRRAASRAQQQEAAAYEAQRQQPTSPAGTDLVTRLSELSTLRESGAPSESEFEAAKAQLLAT